MTTKRLVLIDNTLYDVTNFKHPGGTVISSNYWTVENPIDATTAFMQFHNHAKDKVDRYLKTLPVHQTNITDVKDHVIEDFKKFSDELRREGYFEPDIKHTLFRIVRDIGMYFVGAYLLCTSEAWLCVRFLLGIIITSISIMMLGWLEHEAGHHSIVKNNFGTRFLQKFIFDWMLGGSADFWNYQHNWHHSSTQNVDKDIDLKTFPLLAFHDDIDEMIGHKVPFFIRYQHILWFWVNNSFVPFLWAFIIHPRYCYRKGNYLCLFSIPASLVLKVYILWLCGYSIIGAIFTNYLCIVTGLNLLLMNFTVSHTTQPTHNGVDVNWVDMASRYTVNVTPNIFINNWMGYLNFQIEHHLFPQMPQFKHQYIAKRVKLFLAKHNLPYHEKGYFESLKDVFVNLYNVKNKLIEKESHFIDPTKQN